jgi:hypothetical protein
VLTFLTVILKALSLSPYSPPSLLLTGEDGGVRGIGEVAIDVADVGGARHNNMVINNKDLQKVIRTGRDEIKQAQHKLNSSLTTPIVDSEAKVIILFGSKDYI